MVHETMAKRALITGITGQDGAYLAQLLLEKGYEVFGAYRRSASGGVWRLDELGIADQVRLVSVDLLEFTNIMRVLEKVRPDEVYNLAAQSYVGISFEEPVYTGDVNALGVARLLEAIRTVNPKIRFYQASSSEMFGKVDEAPQDERTPFRPRSPYAISKLYAHWITVNYREAYGIHASSGILFNHESPLRGLEFVTRKITAGLARLKYGRRDPLELGNLEANRDWGFTGDYVYGMWLMLQQPSADDYVLATGEAHSVREFFERVAEHAGFRIAWEGEGDKTRAIDRESGRVVVRVSPEFYRPTDVDHLVGNAERARARLGWAPRVHFDELAEMMIAADMNRVQRGLL
jgi:GDPmannose 4,6-dehydratase